MTELRIYGFQSTPQNILVGIMKILARRLAHHFSPVNVYSFSLPIPDKAYVSSRRQYQAAAFLEVLDSAVPPGTNGLGLINLDLFVPHLNFIFGLAQPGGNALVALPRLRESFYGKPQDSSLYFQRIAKEALHELGHVLGLNHCSNHCVMRFSNTLSDTDQKPDTFCAECLKQLD